MKEPWQIHETNTAERFDGRIRAQSGAGRFAKSDVITPDFLIECKHTAKQQFILKLPDLLTARRHALMEDRTMIFDLCMGQRPWIVMAEEDFRETLRDGIY